RQSADANRSRRHSSLWDAVVSLASRGGDRGGGELRALARRDSRNRAGEGRPTAWGEALLRESEVQRLPHAGGKGRIHWTRSFRSRSGEFAGCDSRGHSPPQREIAARTTGD